MRSKTVLLWWCQEVLVSFLRVSLDTLVCDSKTLKVGTKPILRSLPTVILSVVCVLCTPRPSLTENCSWPNGNGSPLAWEVLPSTPQAACEE